MKNLFTKMMLVAVAAMTFIGCSQEPAEINATVKKTTVELTANIDEVTRSYFGEEVTEGGVTSFPSLWEGSESVKLVAYGEADAVIAQAYGTVEAEEGSATARISATFEGELTGVVKLGAYVGGWSNMTPGVVEVPEEQFMNKEGTVASNAHTMSAEVAWDGTPASLELSFSHQVAYGKMTINECPVAVEDIAKVIVALDEAIYTVQLGDLITSTNVWFACEATEDFATLKVSVVDNNGVTYSKSVDMSALADNQRLKFKTGEVSKFSIKGLVREAADHVVEFTEMSGPVSEDFGSWAGVGMKYTLSNAAGDTMQITFSEADGNPLKAGNYTNSSQCEDGCFYGNGTWIKLAGASETYISSGEVVVALDGSTYTVTYTGTIGGESYETTFTGEVAVWDYFNGRWYSDTNYGIFARTVSGDEFFFDMYCDSSVGHVIPEGTYTYGWTNPRFVYSTVNGSSITDGTVTVAHLESGYQIDINVTTADGNFVYSFSGVVGIQNSGNDFRNPPIAYADYTIDATFSSVKASYDEYSNSFELAFVTEEDATYGIYNINLQLYTPASAENNGLIPAGTYTIGGTEYQISSEANRSNAQPADESNLALKSATLTVAHLADGYELTLNLENVMKTKINGTYSGKIAKANEYNDFRNPGDAVKLATPVAQATVITSYGEPVIEITWEAVENAYEYLVTCEETGDVNTINHEHECQTLFSSLDYNTTYNFTIVANPESESTLYKQSDEGSVSAKTGLNPNGSADYEITLTKITEINGNTISFTGDNAQDKLTLVFNPGLTEIVAGTYNPAPVGPMDVDPYYGTIWSSDSALEIGTYNQTTFNISSDYNQYGYYPDGGGVVTVSISGTTYTIVALLMHYTGTTYKFTYTGALEVTTDDEGGEGEVAATTFNFYGRWDDYYGLTSKSSGVYKLVGENFDIDFAIRWVGYDQTTGALVPGTYTYSYNGGYYPGNGSGYDADDYLYEGNCFTFAGTLNGEALQYNYDSTLVVTDSGITLTIVGGNPSPFVITAGQPTVM